MCAKRTPSLFLKIKSMSGEYNFFAILILGVLSYYFSLRLVKNNTITSLQHRKMWNWVLLLSFAVSGLGGMLLSFAIDNGFRLGFYSLILWIHVESGIVMAVVSVFHILWHKQYFFRGRKKE